MKRSGVSLAAAAVGAAMLCGVNAPANAGGRHVISVTSTANGGEKWSVYGDLYNRNGQKVYHWQETGKPAGKDFVRWEYTDGGDGGWADIYIDPAPGQRHIYKRLRLNQNHCYVIKGPLPDHSYYIWDRGNCPF